MNFGYVRIFVLEREKQAEALVPGRKVIFCGSNFEREFLDEPKTGRLFIKAAKINNNFIFSIWKIQHINKEKTGFSAKKLYYGTPGMLPKKAGEIINKIIKEMS